MTLIALVVAPKQPAFLVSDTALSGGGPILNSDFFPVQESSAEGFFSAPPVKNDVLTGMSQKVWLSGSHAVLWAGRYFFAYSLIRYLSQYIDKLTPDAFLDMANECLGDKISEVSLIYIYSYGDGSTTARFVNCEEIWYNDIRIIVSGTGAYRFITEFDRENPGLDLATTFQQAGARASHMYQKEILDSENYYHGIGIGYEFSILRPSGWEKAPYCLAVFGHSDSSFSLKKTVSTFYRFDELYFVTTTFKNQPNWHMENWIYLPNEQIINGGNVVHVPAFPPRIDIDPLQNWEDLELGDESSKVAPLFTLSLIEFYNELNVGVEPDEFGKICRVPATLGVARNGKNKTLVSRAFFRREVEEVYLGREFVPPPGKEEFYAKQAKDQSAGIALSFESAGSKKN